MRTVGAKDRCASRSASKTFNLAVDRAQRAKQRAHDADPDVQRYRAEKARRARNPVSPEMAQAKRRYVEEVVHASDFRCGRGRRANQRFEARDPVDRLLGSLGEWRGE